MPDKDKPATRRVSTLLALEVDGVTLPSGSEIEVSSADADTLIEQGRAKAVRAKPAKDAEPTEAPADEPATDQPAT